jgi:hypothetical protein
VRRTANIHRQREVQRRAVEKESRENLTIHVIPREDGWAVVNGGNKKVSAVHPNRHQAEQHGRSLAYQSRTDIYVYGKQGRILAHDSYFLE